MGFLVRLWVCMPVERDESFLARVEVGNRVQIPVLVRWSNRLEPGEVLSVYVFFRGPSRSLYVRYRRGHRITIPKLVVEDLGLEPGCIVEVTLYSEAEEEEEDEK